MNPKIIVEQKITAFVNKYSVYASDPLGKKAELVAFAQQKRFAFKEKVIFFNDTSKNSEIFNLGAEKVLDVHGKYIVRDVEGQQVGVFQKIFGKSLFISSWNILNNEGQVVMTVTESSIILAILRRFLGIVPYIGDYLGWLVLLFKYHFKFLDAEGNEVGRYQKTTLFRDHYLLSMTDEGYAKCDWRTFAAIAVALDALQSR